MKKRTLIGLLFVTLLIFMAGCATNSPTYHKYIMRGQILEVNDNIAYLCIGSSDGASVGQELVVFKIGRMPPPSRSSEPRYKKEKVGKVKIMEIVDEHYAKANVLTGEVKANYVVELMK